MTPRHRAGYVSKDVQPPAASGLSQTEIREAMYCSPNVQTTASCLLRGGESTLAILAALVRLKGEGEGEGKGFERASEAHAQNVENVNMWMDVIVF